MRNINTNTITSKTLAIQIISAVLIVLSYFTTPYLNIVAGIICFFYIISNIKQVDRFALFFFLFPLSNVFKLQAGQTSIFMVLRVAIVLAILIYDTKKFNNPSLYLMAILTVIYDMCISAGNDVAYVVRLVNIILWLVVIYCMQCEISEDNILPVSRSLVNGTIISCFVGINMDSIPNMRDAVSDIQVYISANLSDSRFSGLFNDPNIFTVLICMCLWACYLEYSKGNFKTTEFSVRTMLISFFGAITYSKSCILIMSLFWLYVLLSKNKIKPIAKFSIGLFFGLALVYFFAINTEWFEIMTARFGSDSHDLDTLTTGRTTIWKAYVGYLYQSGSWVWGSGLSPLLPLGRGAHNTILEYVYYVGVVGSFIMYRFFRLTYMQTPSGNRPNATNHSGFMFLLFIFFTMFFLDSLEQEIYYYALALCFIYMKKISIKDDNVYQLNNCDV